MKKIVYLFYFSTIAVSAQVGIGTSNPHPNALLELQTTDNGVLMPRVELESTTSFSPLSIHEEGMIVYNTRFINDVTPGFYYNNGSIWVKMTRNSKRIGDVKHGFQAADHNGWYLLNGRLITSITSVEARNNAIALGFATNLPNAADRFLKNRTGVETLGSLGGNTSFTITQANLPNFNMTGSTNSAGNHSHTYQDSGPGTSNVGSGANNPIANNEVNNGNTGTSGAHTHQISVPSLGSNTPVNHTPQYLATNIFIYLGN
jgi:hypothetical protein